jgi:hypothetical protein
MQQSNEEAGASSMLPRLMGTEQRLGLMTEAGPDVRTLLFLAGIAARKTLNLLKAQRYFWGTTYTTVSHPSKPCCRK